MSLPLPSVSEIVALVKKGATLEAQEKIMELRQAVLDAQEENLDLRQKVQELQAALDLGKELNFDGLVYWRTRGGKREGPFCPQCRDAKSLVVHLQSNPPGWRCATCKEYFGPPRKVSVVIWWGRKLGLA